MRSLVSTAGLMAALALGAPAAIRTGPEVGAKLPNFQAVDQFGKTRTLSSLMGPKGVFLVVYRSADWCPYCKAELVELEQNAKEFEKLGLKVAGLSYDTPAILKAFAQRKSIHFPLLSDPDSAVFRQLGILNEDVPKNTPFYGIPHPGTYILDRDGKIVAKYFEEDYKQRYTAADILVQRYGVKPDGQSIEIEGKQLKAVTSASNSIVKTGQRVALVLDLELKPGMHVYAPGVEGYIPIEWKMAASELATAHPPSYPKPEILFLEAINEKVPVFKGKVRLTRDATIGADATIQKATDVSGQFSIMGTLRYQACDDHMCYIPQELPLRWMFTYEGYDKERVPAELQRKAPQ